MKPIVTLLLSLACTVASAQVKIPSDAKAPVNQAAGLYLGCMQATLLTADRPTVSSDILPFINELDIHCLEWTVIWYRTTGDDIQKWPEDKKDRFEALRSVTLKSLLTSLVKVTK